MAIQKLQQGENIFLSDSFRESFNALVDEVERLRTESFANIEDDTPASVPYMIPVRLSSVASNGLGFNFVEQEWDGSNWSDKVDGLRNTDLGPARPVGQYEEGDPLSFHIISCCPIGSVVYIFPTVDASSDTENRALWQFVPNVYGTVFWVIVNKDGGQAGDNSTQCDFTYAVTSGNNNFLYGEGLTPHNQRPEFGEMKEATQGLGFYSPTRQFMLSWVNEQIAVDNCS